MAVGPPDAVPDRWLYGHRQIVAALAAIILALGTKHLIFY